MDEQKFKCVADKNKPQKSFFCEILSVNWHIIGEVVAL